MQHENKLILIHTRSHMKDTSTYIGHTCGTLKTFVPEGGCMTQCVLTCYYVDASLLSHEEKLASSLPSWQINEEARRPLLPVSITLSYTRHGPVMQSEATCRHRGKCKAWLITFNLDTDWSSLATCGEDLVTDVCSRGRAVRIPLEIY